MIGHCLPSLTSITHAFFFCLFTMYVFTWDSVHLYQSYFFLDWIRRKCEKRKEEILLCKISVSIFSFLFLYILSIYCSYVLSMHIKFSIYCLYILSILPLDFLIRQKNKTLLLSLHISKARFLILIYIFLL